MSNYRFDFEADDNDTYLVTVPALPEVSTFADTLEEAQLRARQGIEEALAARMAAARDPIPTDRDAFGSHVILLPLLTELKVDLYNTLKARGVTRAELARRLEWKRNSVDRLFDLNHHSRLEQIEAAFRAVGMSRRADAAPVFAES
jgi:antitoxin HicB